MSSYGFVPTGILNPQRDLCIAFNIGWNFKCNICKETGEELHCFCNKCKRYMHPICAGVKIWTECSTYGTKQIVQAGSEKLPESCRDCLREMKEIVSTNLHANQQFSPTYDVRIYKSPPPLGNQSSVHAFPINNSHSIQAPCCSSSITSVIELGKSHKVEEGHDDCMIHRHNPGHDLWLKDNGNYSCYGCKMDGFGSHYACRNASCSFLLHQECLSPRKTTTHIFFPKSIFLFMCLPITSYSKHGKKEHTNVFCVACGMNVNGYHYHDRNGLYNLHPCCINLPAQIICGDSGVEMLLQKEPTSKCVYCHERSVKGGKSSTDHGWSYVAKSENYHLHVGCIIKMLSDLREDSMGRLISCKMTSENRVGRMNLNIVVRRIQNKMCEKKFTIFIKYARIVLGAIIAALLGDPTTLFVNTAMALIPR